MQQGPRAMIKIMLSILLALTMLAQFGCANRTVRALDYSLEEELYADETQDQQSGEPTPAPATSTQTPLEPPVETTPAEISATPAPETPTPEQTEEGEAAPSPSATPELHRLRVLVQDDAAVLAGARVTLYQDESVLYSGFSGSDGNVSWMLPPGYQYRVKASLAGYFDGEGDGSYDLTQDTLVKITLVRSEDAEEGTATPTPLPVPEGAPGKVTITAPDVVIQQDQSDFSLLDGVSAKTEFGLPVAVWVVDNGGFAIATGGSYRVTYGAFEDGKLVTAQRTVTVEGAAEQTPIEDQAHAPYASSKERYEVLVEYRNLAGASLSERVDELNEAYRQKVEEALSQNEQARILAAADLENDTDAMAGAAKNMQQTQDFSITNWPDVLATFLSRYVEDEDRPLDAEALAQIPLDKLDGVFWDMNAIEVYRIDGTDNVMLSAKSFEDMAAQYGMSVQRKSFLYELMQPEFLRTFASITGNDSFTEEPQQSAEELLSTLPDETNIERNQVVETALSLVGKVSYVLGGKYNRLGWNNAWGNANDAEEGEPVKISQKKGLDCSGFVSWVFINAVQDTEAVRVIGNGSTAQWRFSTAIGWDEGRPGDLAFYYAPGERQYNHVGIIVSCDADGSYLVAHCSSVQDGVVVTDGWSNGFRYLRRPAFFQ